jgi:hypothetical protein
LKNDGHRVSAALERIITELAILQPCRPPSCLETSVWEALLGVDRTRVGVVSATAWANVMVAVFLLLYNLCRAVLTWRVGPLRDEEERSGYSPAYTGQDGYGWLIWLHRAVQVLLVVAVTSFLVHMWHWLNMPVWVFST